MDHDANVAPWLLMAEDAGMKVRWMEFDAETFEFADDALTKVLSPRTRMVAFGYASNCTGTINDVIRFCAQARAAGALTYVDAVQFAPHGLIDVQTLGCDFFVSSAYKWFGPHIAALWARREQLDDLFAYKVRPAGGSGAHRFETGTLSHEGMAGCIGAIDYIASNGTGTNRRERLTSAWKALETYEQSLSLKMIEGLRKVPGLRIHGITSANAMHRRVPTISFTVAGKDPAELAQHFARSNIFVWSGHNYAIEPIAAMGLTNTGGVLRVGLAHYNTSEEISAFLNSLHQAI
jgi:cysteine desulfurase family protein (TIGR01976 family)